MKEWKSVDDVLDFAIAAEIAAQEFYAKLAEEAEKPWMRDVFLGFAAEEKGHQIKLEGVKSGKRALFSSESVMDLKIGDYIPKVQLKEGEELSYPDALVVAMHAEKAAFKLYSDMADKLENEELKEVFRGLALEEAKHKLRFEVEYDEAVLLEN